MHNSVTILRTEVWGTGICPPRSWSHRLALKNDLVLCLLLAVFCCTWVGSVSLLKGKVTFPTYVVRFYSSSGTFHSAPFLQNCKCQLWWHGRICGDLPPAILLLSSEVHSTSYLLLAAYQGTHKFCMQHFCGWALVWYLSYARSSFDGNDVLVMNWEIFFRGCKY